MMLLRNNPLVPTREFFTQSTRMSEMAQHSRPELDSDGKKAPEMAQHRLLLASGQQDFIPHKKQSMSSRPNTVDADMSQQEGPLVLDTLNRDDDSISAELVRAIISEQSKTTPSSDSATVRGVALTQNTRLNADEISSILNNPPMVWLKRLSTLPREGVKPKAQCAIKKFVPVGTYPTVKNASKLKFKLAKHGIRCKFKCKYSYKCQIVQCAKKFTNVKDWNLHHRKHHPDVNYTCKKCNKVSSTLIQHRDHVYNHKEMQLICGRCCKSFPSISQLNLHRHLHKRQWLYSCFAADCKWDYKWPQDLLQHLKVHLSERYKCTKCSCSILKFTLMSSVTPVGNVINNLNTACKDTDMNSSQNITRLRNKTSAIIIYYSMYYCILILLYLISNFIVCITMYYCTYHLESTGIT